MKRGVVAGIIAMICLPGGDWSIATASPPVGKALPPIPGAPVVSGTVSCRERIELPGMAMLHVELLDASAEAPTAPVLGEDSSWIAAGKLPVSFRIAYDPSRIDPSHVYVLRARVIDGEKVLLTSTTPYYVLTQGASRTADIIVVPARVRIR